MEKSAVASKGIPFLFFTDKKVFYFQQLIQNAFRLHFAWLGREIQPHIYLFPSISLPGIAYDSLNTQG